MKATFAGTNKIEVRNGGKDDVLFIPSSTILKLDTKLSSSPSSLPTKQEKCGHLRFMKFFDFLISTAIITE